MVYPKTIKMSLLVLNNEDFTNLTLKNKEGKTQREMPTDEHSHS